MKRSRKFLFISAAIVALCVLSLSLVACSAGNPKYFEEVSSYKFWANKGDQAVAQTKIYNIVEDHLNNVNGKEKKVLLLGFDGMRADALVNIRTSGVVKDGVDVYSGYNTNAKNSGVNKILDNGGKAYISYAGGEYGKDTKQATSTAPGWAALTSGVWGKDNGVVDNGMAKNLKYKTFMLKFAEEKGMSSAFLAEWSEHFNLTYKSEIEYLAAHKNIDMLYKQHGTDAELHQSVLASVTAGSETEKDITFCIYEAPDYSGHHTKFENKNHNYVNAVRNTDNYFYEVINAVEARPNYANEDWLIILTTDHGGMGYGHGMQKAEARTTFIITNKDVPAKYFSKNYDGMKQN